MAPLSTTLRRLKKAFGLQDSPPNALEEQLQSQPTATIYHERDPTVQEWLWDIWPSWRAVGLYFLSLFPFLNWIPCYNWQWLVGDLISGIHSPRSPGCTDRIVADSHRNHCRRCGYPAEHGIRQAGQFACSIWSLHIVHGSFRVLVFRDIKRYHHWRKPCPFRCGSEVKLTILSSSPSP